MSPFIVPSLKKIVEANLEKIVKVDFRDIHTDRQTYIPERSYRTFPGGGPEKIVPAVLEKNQQSVKFLGKFGINRHGTFTI